MASSLISILDRSNQPLGEFPIEEVRRRLRSGQFQGDQLGFAEGLEGWMPLSDVVTRFNQAPSFPRWSPPGGAAAEEFSPTYAHFLLRLIAHTLDTLVILLTLYAVIFGLMLAAHPHQFAADLRHGLNQALDQAPAWIKVLFLPMGIAEPFLYFGLMESSPRQGTLGKMAVKIVVTDMKGRRLNFAHAAGRFAAKLVSCLTFVLFFAGFWMAAFTPRRQALHDYLARTLVVKR